MATRNVTITLDDATARWARVEAARRDVSVSRFVGDLLREEMRRADEYGAAMERWMSRQPFVARHAEPYPSREEVHDRARLRRLERDRLRPGSVRPGEAGTG